MATVFTEKQWCSSPVAYWKCDVTTTRSGQNVTYAFTFTVRFTGSYTWFNNGLAVVLSLDGTSKGQKQIKAQTSGQIGAKSYTLNWSETVSKTSGTTSFSATLKDTNTSNNRNSQTANLEVPAAGSSMGSVTAGSTLNGPTINVTRYDSSFTDNITLSYNGYTIPRNNFTSGKLTFSEAERLTIFQAQGAGQTKSWSISGNTYSGSTWLGSYSGSVNITTEALSNVTAAANFNVESNTTYSTSNDCGGGTKVIAYVGGYGTSGSISVFDSGIFTGKKSSATATMAASTIYNSNISTKNGTIYWCTYSYIKDGSNNWQHIGTVNSRTCTYNFVQSLCGPSMTSLQYKVTDPGTKALMGASGNYYNYNDSTDLGKFIRNKTTLNISYSASVKNGKGTGLSISNYTVSITGQSDINKGTSTTADIPALTTAGTITVTAKDSRGFPTSLSFSYNNINEYWEPAFMSSITAVRNPMSATNPNNDKIVTIKAEISMPTFMANYVKNNAGSTYYLKYFTSPAVSDNTNLLSNCTVGTNKLTLTYVTGQLFNQSTQYSLYLKITDYYNSSSGYASGSVTIPISAPLISRRSQKVGINKIPGSYTLDVGGTFGCSGNATIGGNATITGTTYYGSGGRQDYSTAGFTYNQFGNMQHRGTSTSNSWQMMSYDGTTKVRIYPESGNTTLAGTLSVGGNTSVNGSTTITNTGGQFRKDDASSWIADRDRATVRNNNNGSTSGYASVVSQKTANGNWSIGAYQSNPNNLIFCYTTDSDYSSSNNDHTQAVLRNTGGTIALTSEIPTNNNQLTNGRGFITLSGAMSQGVNSNRYWIKFESGLAIVHFCNANFETSSSYYANANAVTNFSLSFPFTFTTKPSVAATFCSDSSAAQFAGLAISATAITTSGFTLRLFNNTSSKRWPYITYIAMGNWK